MAEGITRHLAEQAGIDMEVDSAGTGNYHIGEAPDKRAQALMAKKGISIDSLRARQFDPADFQSFDRIFAMDRYNLKDIRDMVSDESAIAKSSLFLELSRERGLDVPDPFYGGDEGFEAVYEMLHESAVALMAELNG